MKASGVRMFRDSHTVSTSGVGCGGGVCVCLWVCLWVCGWVGGVCVVVVSIGGGVVVVVVVVVCGVCVCVCVFVCAFNCTTVAFLFRFFLERFWLQVQHLSSVLSSR